MRHPRSTTTVAEAGGKVAGFCVVDWKLESGRKVGHFITIDVAPELRRNGLGRLLMQAGRRNWPAWVVSRSRSRSRPTMRVRRSSTALGYQQTGRIPGYYADGTNALVMRKACDVTD